MGKHSISDNPNALRMYSTTHHNNPDVRVGFFLVDKNHLVRGWYRHDKEFVVDPNHSKHEHELSQALFDWFDEPYVFGKPSFTDPEIYYWFRVWRKDTEQYIQRISDAPTHPDYVSACMRLSSRYFSA